MRLTVKDASQFRIDIDRKRDSELVAYIIDVLDVKSGAVADVRLTAMYALSVLKKRQKSALRGSSKVNRVKRYIKYIPPYDERNKAGEKICVMCGRELTGQKVRWCGRKECFQLKFVRSGDVGSIRDMLKEREGEICQLCGFDCGYLKLVLIEANSAVQSSSLDRGNFHQWCKSIGINVAANGVTWQGDHIAPLSEGGEHDPYNFRTLCISCHQGETNKLRQRLRKIGKELYIAEGQSI